MQKRVVVGLVLALAMVVFGLAIAAPNVLNYFSPTGGKQNTLVIGGTENVVSGGALVVKSGATIQIDSGATATLSGAALVGTMPFTQGLVICGDDAGTTTTNYLGPALGDWKHDGSDASLASGACSALDDTTEATADLVVSSLAMKAHGMRCISDSTQAAGESLTMTLRSAAADTVPVISCVIGAAATECRSNTATTTNIAAGATMAVKVVPSGNNGAGHVWCLVTMSMP